MQPIIPFEPIRGSYIPSGGGWTYEVKWDGVRILSYFDGQKTQLNNRKLRDRTLHYPEITDMKTYCRAKSVILDGEVIALADDGKPSFHEVMRRDGIRRMERVERAKNEVPITYMIFDIIYLNGRWIDMLPLSERKQLLAENITANEHVQIVSTHDNGQALFDVIQNQGMEGIVCKQLESSYSIDGKDDRWVKFKNYGDVIAVIGGFTLNGGIVSAILVGLYDHQGRFLYIGHVGTGKLTKAEWRSLTDILKLLVIKERPFTFKHENMKADTFWVKPQITVKIMYTEWRWHEGRTLRQPSLQSFVNVPPEECLFER